MPPNHPFLKEDKRIIFHQVFINSNEREIHERIRTKIISEIANLGGLYAVTIAIFMLIYWLIVEPYRDLHLAVSFNRMKNQICRQEGLISTDSSFDEQYESGLGIWFNIYLLVSKRLPHCFQKPFNSFKSESLSFRKILSHFDELVNQVNHQLSVRFLTTSTLHSQKNLFKTQLLEANQS